MFLPRLFSFLQIQNSIKLWQPHRIFLKEFLKNSKRERQHGDKSTTKNEKESFQRRNFGVISLSKGSKSNHDMDGDENDTNLHMNEKRNCFARFARVFLIFANFTAVLVQSTS